MTNNDFPTTTNASLAVQTTPGEEEPSADNHERVQKRKRKNRLSIFDVSQIAVTKGIRTRLELLACANQQKSEEKINLEVYWIKGRERGFNRWLGIARGGKETGMFKAYKNQSSQ